MLPGHTRHKWKELQNNTLCLHTIKCVGPGSEKNTGSVQYVCPLWHHVAQTVLGFKVAMIFEHLLCLHVAQNDVIVHKTIVVTHAIFTARKRSLGQGIIFISVCHYVHWGRGSIPACITGHMIMGVCIQGVYIQWGPHPGGLHPSGGWADYPPPHQILRDMVNRKAVRIRLNAFLLLHIFWIKNICILFCLLVREMMLQLLWAKNFDVRVKPILKLFAVGHLEIFACVLYKFQWRIQDFPDNLLFGHFFP